METTVPSIESNSTRKRFKEDEEMEERESQKSSLYNSKEDKEDEFYAADYQTNEKEGEEQPEDKKQPEVSKPF